MKKKYIKPAIDVLDIEEETVLLTGSIIKSDSIGAVDMDSRNSNTAFAEDEDISGDDF